MLLDALQFLGKYWTYGILTDCCWLLRIYPILKSVQERRNSSSILTAAIVQMTISNHVCWWNFNNQGVKQPLEESRAQLVIKNSELHRERWTDKYDMSLGKRKSLRPRQESNQWSLEHIRWATRTREEQGYLTELICPTLVSSWSIHHRSTPISKFTIFINALIN